MTKRAWICVGLRFAFASSLGVVLSTGCYSVQAFSCENDDVCMIGDREGTCLTDTNTCIYPDGNCPSGFSDGNGNCFIGGFGDGSGDSMGTTPGTTAMMTTSALTDGPVTSGDSSTTDPTTTDAESSSDTGTNTDPCGAPNTDITGLGVVGASTTFMNFNPILSVDSDLSTSWFSTGPEPMMLPTIYSWTLSEPRCIATIFIVGNGLHETPSFRTDFGFENATFKVYDALDDVVFSEVHALNGTPDPDTTSNTGGVTGIRVELEFLGHEDDGCGGFSELQILGL